MAGTGDGSGSGSDRQEPGRRADRGAGAQGSGQTSGAAFSAGRPDGPKDDAPSKGAGTNAVARSLISTVTKGRLGRARPNWTRPEAYGFVTGSGGRKVSPPSAAKGRQEGRVREEQGLLWGSFSLALGILAYFSVPEEPSVLAVAGLALPVGAWAFWRYRTRGVSLVTILSLWFLAGFTAGTLRTALVAAPKLEAARTLQVLGVVSERQQAASGPRLIVDVLEAGSGARMSAPGQTGKGLVVPARIRVSVPQESRARAGDHVRLKARLFPPSSAIRPGGYDFSFTAYFSSIGATGFSYGQPEVQEALSASHVRRGLEDLRQALGAKIRRVLPPGDPAELAVALLVGERAGLSEQAEESLRAAGLAHVLAISGLHMGLFAGGAYAALLLLLAMVEPLALRFPLHKIAAGFALMAAAFYLVLSGASVSTQRAFIMISLVFLGTLTARRGLTLHSVALAGAVLLLLRPEQLFHPGFQMSFASVICLIAVYGRWSASRLRTVAHAERAQARGLPLKIALMPLFWTGGVLATTAIAGLATGIIGAHHFGRIASYGMIGNLLGMPLVSLIIMPMGVLALVLMPFGLAALPLFAMEKGLSMLLAVASWTQSLDEGRGTLVPPGAAATLFLTAGLFWLLLAHGRWRLVAAALLGMGVVLAAWDRPADVQIADSGGTVAARDAGGLLRLSTTRESFAGEMWLQAEGLSPELQKTRRMDPKQASCDATGCVYLAYAPSGNGPERNWGGLVLALFGLGPAASGAAEDGGAHTGIGEVHSDRDAPPTAVRPLKIALPKTAEALEMDCHLADVIITELSAPDGCGAELVVSGEGRQELGALSFWLETIPEDNEERIHHKDNSLPMFFDKKVETEGRADRTRSGQASGTSTDGTLRLKTVLSSWKGAKTRPPRPWHR